MHPPSFSSSRDLRSRIEALPSIPHWKHQEFTLPGYKTNSPMIVYWRDGLEVAAHLFSNPIFANCLELNPYRLFEGTDRVYGEFMSGDFAWDYQACVYTY
jgi:hypothetical protein